MNDNFDLFGSGPDDTGSVVLGTTQPGPQIVRADAASRLDAIRRVDGQGEHWTGRDLMPVVDYANWREFAAVIEKAKASLALVQGADAAEHHLVMSPSDGGRWGNQPIDDYRLTRFGAYLVAMAGDDTKQAVAEARVYFAVQTRRAELAVPDLSDPLVALQHASDQLSKSVALALAERQRAELAESNVRVLLPAANAWSAFLDAGRSMEVGPAAKCLVAHGVDTGRNRLYALLREWRWVFQRSREPMGAAVERGYVRLALDKPHTNPKTGEEEDGAARTRITGKGLERLADHFGIALDMDIVNQYLDQQESAA